MLLKDGDDGDDNLQREIEFFELSFGNNTLKVIRIFFENGNTFSMDISLYMF